MSSSVKLFNSALSSLTRPKPFDCALPPAASKGWAPGKGEREQGEEERRKAWEREDGHHNFQKVAALLFRTNHKEGQEGIRWTLLMMICAEQ